MLGSFISIHSFFGGFQYLPRYFLETVLSSSSAISLLKNVVQSFLITRRRPNWPSSSALYPLQKYLTFFPRMIQNRFNFKIKIRDIRRVFEVFRNVFIVAKLGDLLTLYLWKGVLRTFQASLPLGLRCLNYVTCVLSFLGR